MIIHLQGRLNEVTRKHTLMCGDQPSHYISSRKRGDVTCIRCNVITDPRNEGRLNR